MQPFFGLILSSAERTEDDPVDAASGIIVDQPEDGSAAADLDVIRVSTEAEDRERTILFQIELQIDHRIMGQYVRGTSNPERSMAQSSVLELAMARSAAFSPLLKLSSVQRYPHSP